MSSPSPPHSPAPDSPAPVNPSYLVDTLCMCRAHYFSLLHVLLGRVYMGTITAAEADEMRRCIDQSAKLEHAANAMWSYIQWNTVCDPVLSHLFLVGSAVFLLDSS